MTFNEAIENAEYCIKHREHELAKMWIALSQAFATQHIADEIAEIREVQFERRNDYEKKRRRNKKNSIGIVPLEEQKEVSNG